MYLRGGNYHVFIIVSCQKFLVSSNGAYNIENDGMYDISFVYFSVDYL